LNVILLKGEEKNNYSVLYTPDKPTQYWEDRNEYIGGGGCDGKYEYFETTNKLFYISCKGKNLRLGKIILRRTHAYFWNVIYCDAADIYLDVSGEVAASILIVEELEEGNFVRVKLELDYSSKIASPPKCMHAFF
jgi:hypothetical protein